MRNRKRYIVLVLAMTAVLVIFIAPSRKEIASENSEEHKTYKSIAYVTVPASEHWRWIGTDGEKDDDAISEVDTDYITHINFAFGMLKTYQYENVKLGSPLKDGKVASKEAYKNPRDGKYHFKAALQGWIEEMNQFVDGREYLHALVDLKKEKPELKVLLSIGGWNSDGFCYMAETKEGRKEFIESCIQLINEYSLDGIDIDWEYPTNGGWGEIAHCSNCMEDAKALIKELSMTLKKAFPKEPKLLSIASGASQPWVDTETLGYLDYINVMCYDQNSGTGTEQAGMEL